MKLCNIYLGSENIRPLFAEFEYYRTWTLCVSGILKYRTIMSRIMKKCTYLIIVCSAYTNMSYIYNKKMRAQTAKRN